MARDMSDLDQWLQRSTQASGVPVKVKNRAVIAALQVLVQGARRTRPVATRDKAPKP